MFMCCGDSSRAIFYSLWHRTGACFGVSGFRSFIRHWDKGFFQLQSTVSQFGVLVLVFRTVNVMVWSVSGFTVFSDLGDFADLSQFGVLVLVFRTVIVMVWSVSGVTVVFRLRRFCRSEFLAKCDF